MKTINVDDGVAEFISNKVLETGKSPSQFLIESLGIPKSSQPSAARLEQNALADVLSDPVFLGTRSVVGKFLHILASVYKKNQLDFEKLPAAFQGRSRTYIAKTIDGIDGKSAQPKQIPGSPFFVETLSSTSQKMSMLRDVLKILGYDQKTISAAVTSIRKG